jgi:Cd2+/Zn2+-exporting ATPase
MTPPIELPMAAPTAPEPDVAEPLVGKPEDVRRFRVEGMDCAACAQTVQKAVAALDGVDTAQVSFGAGTLVIAGEAEDETITAAVSRAGYRAQSATRRATAGPTVPFWRRDLRAMSTTASVALLLFAVIVDLAGVPRAVAEPLYLVSIAVGGWPIARAATAALRHRSLDMNVLMALAAVGAVGIGAYAEAAWVLVLFAVGTGLEALALERSRLSVQELMDLAPAQARVLRDGREELVDATDVEPGTLFVVRPGERLALDGVVSDGASSVDQAPITGESVPVDKEPGDEVFAGTLNVQGALIVRTTKFASQSTLSRVADLVERAQASQAPAERFIDRFARIYTPLVFATALTLAIVPPLLFGGDVDTWLYRSLALLIVACPCSLVISVPVAVVSAVGGAARRGVLIKGGQALEDLAAVRVVAVDKTGTLTLGLPTLASVVTLNGLGEYEALRLIAAVEQHSEHPLAGALRRAAGDRDLVIPEITDFEALPGRGARGRVEERELWAGGPRLAADRAGASPDAFTALQEQGQTAVALGEGDRVLAVFGLADQLRPETEHLVPHLRAAGIERILMLTGDSEAVARSVAERTGLDDHRADLLPADKLTVVEELGRDRAVAMVGDGVNDAPALTAARVGIAMGAAGSDIALKSADVALMGDRLDRLPETFADARKAMSIMRVNVVASLVVKAVFVLLAPFGLVTLVIAIAADMGMSLLVTFNSLRLLRRRPGDAEHHAPGMSIDPAADDGCGEACCANDANERNA